MNSHSDIYEFKKECSVSSVMVARAAEWNPSIFRTEGKLDVHTVIKQYLKLVSIPLNYVYTYMYFGTRYLVESINITVNFHYRANA